MLYIVPSGRVAYFTGWTLFGLDKDEWSNLHIIFAIIMTIFVIWHLIVNWGILKRYLFSLESLFSIIIIVLVSAGTITQIQPFKAVSQIQNNIKNSWEENKVDIPIPHAEKFTLKGL